MLKACVECGQPAKGTRCPKHQRHENARRSRKAKAHGLKTPHWQKVRQERLALDGGLCTFRLPRCTYYAETVHLDPELRGNHRLATLDNTRSACRRCHGTVDAPRSKGP